MKKLEKKQISELKEAMPILDSQELQSFIGGDGKKYHFNESGQIDSSLTEEFKDSGTFDIIVVNGVELQLKGSVSEDTKGNVSFQGDAALFEFMANNTSADWTYGWDEDSSSGVICTDPGLLGPKWIEYDSLAHSHGSSWVAEITDEEMDVVNGLPSQSDINAQRAINELRAQEGLPPQKGIIYNERTGEWQDFDENSQTQEDYLRSKGHDLEL